MNETGQQRGHRWFAATYDALNRSGERRTLGKMRRALLQELHGDVIEIGAGTGANFEHYPPDARVIALEPDPFMLKRAQRRLAALKLSNIDLRIAPAEHLPFDAASFDSAAVTLVLCSVDDAGQSLAELRRVLRPGARLAFIEHVRAGGFGGTAQDMIQPAWSWFGAGCHPNRRTEASIRAAGFEIEQIARGRMNGVLPTIHGIARAPA